ncbi:MAG: hypothetical protein JZU64_03940 [Rhodoferax sp.]|jgi:hypothetical protein|nr:hypothetical protein [Rhodoferax sp.]
MNSHALTPDQLAEQAGHMEMHNALKAMQQAPTQEARLTLLVDALCGIFESNNPLALAGAAVAILPFLDRGLSGVAV